ncbi:unnamed protein product, partial [Didymodactylos carnosus]
ANGYVTYTLVESKPIVTFLWFQTDGHIMINSTPILGSYQIVVQAEDNGSPVRHSSLIQFQLLVGDNVTNATLFQQTNNIDELIFHRSSLSTKRSIAILATCFIGSAIILALIVCTILILICRYRRNKYLYYVKCNENKNKKKQQQERNDVMMIVENRLPILENNSTSSTCSKLSLDDINHKRRSNQSSSSPSCTGVHRADNCYIQQLSSTTKPPQTSDYYSNSSTHQDIEDVEEWTEGSGRMNDANEWSIEKILYPDWLYKDCKTLDTSTFANNNSYRTFNHQQNISPNSNFLNTSLLSQRERISPTTMVHSLTSSVNNSPKQVHFQSSSSPYRQLSNKTLCVHINPTTSAPNSDLIKPYPHLSTTIKQFKSVAKPKDTFI